MSFASELQDANEWVSKHRPLIEEAVAGWWDTGEWSTVLTLGRSAMRRGDMNAFDVLRALPKPLGRIEHPDERIIFRLRAVAVAPMASGLLDAFVRALHIAFETLLNGDEQRPTLSAAELQRQLGLSDEERVRLSRLIFIEYWVLGGGSGDADGLWNREITDTILALRNVRTIDDYLRADAERFWQRPPVAQPHPHASAPAEAPPGMVVEPPPIETPARVGGGTAIPSRHLAPSREPFLAANRLHPKIVREKTIQLLADGHFDEAVRDAALHLRDFLREKTGRARLDGANLVDVALGGTSPMIQVADTSTKSGKQEQAGWHMLASGCVAVMRNPVAHRSEFNDPAATFEALATMSLVARQIDARSDQTSDPPEEAKPTDGTLEPE